MSNLSVFQVAAYCDALLRTSEIQDYDGAVNGLQVENRGGVKRIAAAVDASLTTIQMAAESESSILLVHHGLFWSKRQPWTGVNYELMRLCLENDLALYSSHLPLDVHPRLGNNAQLATALGLKKTTPFFTSKGQSLGVQSVVNLSRQRLQEKLRSAVNGPVHLIPGGPETCRRIGIVTGGAGAEVRLAASEGVDTFITGEGPHWTHALAEELGINILYGGHYATETFGVMALAEHLSRKFRVPWCFLDHPTGL